MKRILVMLAMLILAASAFALPTVEAVQAQVQQGHYAQAESMMREVVAARPGSARAHYVYAEILAHDQHFDQALRETELARKLAPDLGFTQPETFRAFEQLLQREQGAARPSPPVRNRLLTAAPMQQALGGSSGNGSSGLPGWAWALGAVAIASLLWRLFSRPSPASFAPPAPPSGMAGPSGVTPAAPGYGPGPGPGPGYGPGYGPSAGAPSAGSGMLGTGLAAAGGVATGMLVEKLLEGRSGTGVPGTGVPGAVVPEAGSGLAPVAAGGEAGTNVAAEQLEQRQVDFGSGDEWGAGSSDGGGGDWGGDSNDGGGGGGDDGSNSDDGW